MKTPTLLKSTFLKSLSAVAAFALAAFIPPATAAEKVDVLVYGATPGGIAAAVNAAREGASVVLLQEDGHIGGLHSGGLSNPDFRSFECLGGTWREILHRSEQHYIKTYGEGSQQVIDSQRGAYSEPRVSRKIFEDMLGETDVTIRLHRRLDSVRTDPEGGSEGRARLLAASFYDTSGTDGAPIEYEATVFIDATYEGDLIAAAGVETVIGCEGKAAYGESIAFDEPNDWVMAYNFRVCMTTDPDNFIPIEEPEGYDREAFRLLIDGIKDGSIKSLRNPGPTPAILKVRPIPNHKADFNDDANVPISLALKNINHPWPEGDPETRRGIFEEYKHHHLAIFWFLGNDPEVPEEWREEMRRWGLPKDEFDDTGNWTPALYVREGRRMVGVTVFTEHDTQPAEGSVRAPVQHDAIAVADYSLNSHGVYSPEPGVNLGRIGKQTVPYGIPYGVILPKEVDGLLSPVALSASRVGYSALRMEPCWTALGQAAGIAAAMAVKDGGEVRDVPVPDLQERLWDLGAMTVYVSDLAETSEIPLPAWDPPGSYTAAIHDWPPTSPWFVAVQYFGTHGFFHDLVDPETGPARPGERATGQWRQAFTQHAVGLRDPIDETLAAKWAAKAEVPLEGDLVPDGELTRGDFLNRLYREVRKR